MTDKENDKLENLLLDDTFVRFIKGVASEEERIYWQEWLQRHPDHKLLLRDAKELVQFAEFNEGKIPNPQVELTKLEKSLSESSLPSKKPGKRNLFKAGRRSGGIWFTAAAIIVFIMVSIGIFQFSEISTKQQQEELTTVSRSDYQTGFGEKAFLHLTDGSRIVLNANSHLTYSWSDSNGSGQNIDIHLEGEAWFDIEPHTGEVSRLLRVHTQDGIVEVTGTIFTVQTSSQGTRTVLEEGEVKVSMPNHEDSEHTINATLEPGEMARLLPANDKILLQKVNPGLYTSWIRDVWTFEKTPLSQIAERIETVFGIEVKIPSADLQNKTVSGTISSTNLQLIKEGLSEALHVHVRQEGGTIFITPK